ncbi:MAG: polyphosphate kinase 1 [Pseudomonadota bacterium]|nr:polyphosphate kinase 1 [Pseudomonadota bacterium]
MSIAESAVEPAQQSSLLFNRELSLLAFNGRVLDQSLDQSTPLLERLHFLCISSTNLDEFFEIRKARLQEQVASGSVDAGPDNRNPQELLRQISDYAHRLVNEQYRILNDELIPALERENIRFLRRTEWGPEATEWVKHHFENELLPMLTPMGLDPAHPFPRILNKSLNFLITLQGNDAFGRHGGIAIVQAPRALPRVIRLPKECASGPHAFVFLTSIIHAHVNDLFPGMDVTGCYQFRVTRNSELFVDEEEVQDLLRALEGELASRRYGDSVRLEVADNCPSDMTGYLLRQFGLEPQDLYQVNGPVNLNRLMAVAEMVDRPDLKYPSFTPRIPRRLTRAKNMFDAIRQDDILLHHPFDSFAPVIDFVRQAAADPRVLAIRQTLYRTGPESALVDALVTAARGGKEVTVVIELRARFDEEANIGLATVLQEAGAHVVYGVVGYKTHAKMILVVRRERGRLRHYVHLGTGNYHDRTARLYTDFGLLTCADAVGDDVDKLFRQLTGLGRVPKLSTLLQSPFVLHLELLHRIGREAELARKGLPARIVAKLNALTEPRIIQALYDASSAGVRIDLIVRGICCLRPGLPGVSERIRVYSVVGRFLEHTRVYWFLNAGRGPAGNAAAADTEIAPASGEVLCASADWMDRNFFRRVEVAFPVENQKLHERVVREALNYYLRDNTHTWELGADGSYRRLSPGDSEPWSAQTQLIQELCESR